MIYDKNGKHMKLMEHQPEKNMLQHIVYTVAGFPGWPREQLIKLNERERQKVTVAARLRHTHSQTAGGNWNNVADDNWWLKSIACQKSAM